MKWSDNDVKTYTYIPIRLSGVAVGGFLGVVFMCCFISAGQADKKETE